MASHSRTIALDISADGSKIIWTDGVEQIFIADSNGANQRQIATELPRNGGGTEGPAIPINPRITADGSQVYFFHTGGGIDIAGAYSVGAGGGAPSQLFSYHQLAQFFGADP
jgi:Tol biopolymer transport system component